MRSDILNVNSSNFGDGADVGNGVNRDTHITTNVQQADEDLRKDMILTEAGLEVSLPETHALFNLEGVI